MSLSLLLFVLSSGLQTPSLRLQHLLSLVLLTQYRCTEQKYNRINGKKFVQVPLEGMTCCDLFFLSLW